MDFASIHDREYDSVVTGDCYSLPRGNRWLARVGCGSGNSSTIIGTEHSTSESVGGGSLSEPIGPTDENLEGGVNLPEQSLNILSGDHVAVQAATLEEVPMGGFCQFEDFDLVTGYGGNYETANVRWNPLIGNRRLARVDRGNSYPVASTSEYPSLDAERNSSVSKDTGTTDINIEGSLNVKGEQKEKIESVQKTEFSDHQVHSENPAQPTHNTPVVQNAVEGQVSIGDKEIDDNPTTHVVTQQQQMQEPKPIKRRYTATFLRALRFTPACTSRPEKLVCCAGMAPGVPNVYTTFEIKIPNTNYPTSNTETSIKLPLGITAAQVNQYKYTSNQYNGCATDNDYQIDLDQGIDLQQPVENDEIGDGTYVKNVEHIDEYSGENEGQYEYSHECGEEYVDQLYVNENYGESVSEENNAQLEDSYDNSNQNNYVTCSMLDACEEGRMGPANNYNTYNTDAHVYPQVPFQYYIPDGYPVQMQFKDIPQHVGQQPSTSTGFVMHEHNENCGIPIGGSHDYSEEFYQQGETPRDPIDVFSRCMMPRGPFVYVRHYPDYVDRHYNQ